MKPIENGFIHSVGRNFALVQREGLGLVSVREDHYLGNFAALRRGQRVEFQIQPLSGGKERAVNVRAVDASVIR